MGVGGALAEIGTFEGRFFIAMALGLAAGETALGIDRFDWPDAGVERRFLANCAAHGVARDRFVAWKADSREIGAAEFGGKLGQKPLRFCAYRQPSTRDCLTQRSRTGASAAACTSHRLPRRHAASRLSDDGVARAFDYLTRHPEMRALVGRRPRGHRGGGEIPALPRPRRSRRYQQDLMAAFARFQYTLGADMESYLALVLTPNPRLAEVE